MGDRAEIIFSPISCGNISYLESISHLLPYSYKEGKILNIDKKTFLKNIETSLGRFPYNKDIR